ncbi:hypothetical protein [Clostridium guangxiense]|uniref:hypothetical protein n=1 Tax=Clostridium guangxiense TaxID=1662055 RepID=UPI001E5BBF64|nr:hypothetical protein [Clostridium guangxiense]MCD2348005.1 hypothetical protein [Clostridium guangxiense]
MQIIDSLKKLLEGRGFYATFMFMFSWTYTLILFVVLLCQIFLYIFRVKYYNPELKDKSKEENKKNNDLIKRKEG